MILFYILAGMFTALMLAGAVVAVYKMGENELICKYGYTTEEDKK